MWELVLLAAAASAAADDPKPADAKPVSTVADALKTLDASGGSVSPAPKPSGLAKPPQPIGKATAWVTTNDYPPEALRENIEGTTRISLDIDKRGAITDCAVISGSGSKLLDLATCALVWGRARFSPAVDPGGNWVAGTFPFAVTWKIPRDSPALQAVQAGSPLPPGPRASHLVEDFTVEKDGSVTDCKVDSSFPGAVASQMCQQFTRVAPYLDADGNPVRKHVKLSSSAELTNVPGD